MKHKTVEVGEETPVIEAVAALLFQIGHLVAKKQKRFAVLFGEGIRSWKESEEALLNRLAHDGHLVDRLASAWAQIVFRQYWDTPEGEDLIRRHIWTTREWNEYFSVV
jgi:hypothetical protein